MSDVVKVLVVGQTPPPYHGQAIMIERLLRGNFERVQLCHVRMAFSDSIGDVGHFRIGKLFHLLTVIAKIAFCRCVHRPAVLCYPPAGPNRVPLYRDIAILLCTRWMFRQTILYFHAGGVSQLYPQLSRPVRWLARRALFNADAAIRISHGAPDDPAAFHARREYVVPNGIEDRWMEFSQLRTTIRVAAQKMLVGSNIPHVQNEVIESDSSQTAVCAVAITESSPLRILFVAMLSRSKGLLVLMEACGLLAQRGVPFHLTLAGQFESAEFEREVRRLIAELNLESHICFSGVLTGAAKWTAFAQAEVLCLPTFYEAETFGLVLVEAMSFALPVVATRWRGIPEIVDDGQTGFLVDIQDPHAVADRLERLQTDPALAQRLGNAGRSKFLQQFTADKYWQTMEDIFVETAHT